MDELRQLLVNKVTAKFYRLPSSFADKDVNNWNHPPANSYPITLESLNAPLGKSFSWSLAGPRSYGPACKEQQLGEGHLHAILQACSKCHLAEP